MRKELILSAALLLLMATLPLSTALSEPLVPSESQVQTNRAETISGPAGDLPGAGIAFGGNRWPYLYNHWELGSTWYDYQHNSTVGKQIVIGDDGTVHFAWMGAETNGMNRRIFYCCFQNGEVGGAWPVSDFGAGYTTIDALDGSAEDYQLAAVIAFHGPLYNVFRSTLAVDAGPCWNAFGFLEHPDGAGAPIWPHVAIDISNKAHLIATHAGGVCYDATCDFASWETPGWIALPTANSGITALPVTSEFDGSVALLTHDHLEIHPDDDGLIFSQMNNDVWAFISADGDFTDWEQVEEINITDLFEAQATEHPLPGCVYAYCDIDAVFDSDGNLHVAYTTRPYWEEYVEVDGEVITESYFERWSRSGQIWHALVSAIDRQIEFSHVAGYVGEKNETPDDHAGFFEGDPGAWGSLVDRPSLAIDPMDNTLYCMWRDFTSHSDTSATGYSNAELKVRASCDYGMSWGPALNITESCTPVCVPGECASEAWASLAETVHNSKLQLFLIEDLDAGGMPQQEGVWTENPVWYLQVPVEDVPCGDPWDALAHATQLTDTFWEWDQLEQGEHQIVDFMRVLNEGRMTVELDSIVVFYNNDLPDIQITQLNGNLGDAIPPYRHAEYTYTWNCVTGNGQHDAIVRFYTSGGSLDFRLSNSNPINWDSAVSTTIFETVAESPPLPVAIELAQNRPNPFNATTVIAYSLAAPARVKLTIHNTLGVRLKTLVDGHHPAGRFEVGFTGDELPSGVYFYQLKAGACTLSRKMILVK